jgi:hypothetical protein
MFKTSAARIAVALALVLGAAACRDDVDVQEPGVDVTDVTPDPDGTETPEGNETPEDEDTPEDENTPDDEATSGDNSGSGGGDGGSGEG